jgi:nucleotide-binding universal stress UspA family protein
MNIESNVQSDVVFYRILVPHDLTARSDRALEMAGTMAHPLRSEVVLVHVIDPGDRRQQESIRLMSQAGEVARDQWRFLQIAAKRLLPAGVKSDVRILSGDPQEAILTEARKLGADLLIITTQPLSGAGYPFSGVKIEHIENQAPCPVLTVEVREEDDQASLASQEKRNLETHSLKQYCEISRHLSKKDSHRPVYLGYAHLPASPSGVCDR